MKRKKYLQVISFLCVLSLISGYASYNEPAVNINNISIRSENLSTKIIFEGNSILPIRSSYFSKENPSTIVIDLDNIKAFQAPVFEKDNNFIVKDVKFEKGDAGHLRIFIDLTKKVPYRIYPSQKNTIVELNIVKKTLGKMQLSNDIQKLLEGRKGSPIYLKKIDVSENQESLCVKAKLTNQVIPLVFALDNPLRLVVDLYGTYFSQSHANYPIHKFGVKSLRAAQFQVSNPNTITRLVFDLEEAQFYSLDSLDNELVISFFKEKSTPNLPQLSSIETETIKIEPEKIPSKPEPIVHEKPQPAKEEALENIRIPKPSIPSKSNPVSSTVQEEQFKPKTIAETEEKYTGEILSLKFKDADLRDVILYLGDFANLNVVFDPEVRGTVTCNLENVPWDQALDIILRINKMGKTIERNVLRIAPVNVLMREQEDQRKLQVSKELAGPIIVKTYTLSYSKAKDVQSLLKTKLSDLGEIIIDERTNTLIISDVEERIDLLEKLLSVFDTPTPQVSIEARIVEATSTFIRNLGIQWGWRGIADPFYGNQTSLQFPNKALVDGALIPQGIVTKGIGGPLGGYAINLPAPAFTTALAFSFGNVLDTFRLDLALSALETSGSGRIISAPTVTTQNNKEAEIIQGRQIPVQTVANFTVTTRYVNAALELKATPQITAEGTIIMYIEIRNNAADFANLVNGIPPITTQSAKTTVMVPDGGTTVIGGIYRTEDSITHERVPFIHKIPILGNLFRSFARTKQNRELIIFITPRIIK
ncbi:MAG: type IV pilus secretin PilQ [Candidatus Aminicenantes bacterium]|nr:type IV pilus secretin PilQ [Candidatus Aminicenantes bacterium]